MEQATRRGVLAGLMAAGALPGEWPQAAWGAGGPIDVPVTLTDRRVLVDLMVGAKGPYRFVLDTGGAAGLMEPGLARELQLHDVGLIPLGLAHRQERFMVVEAPSTVVGGAFRTGPVRWAITDLITFGEGARGSLDAGFLVSYPSELSIGAGRWRLYDTRLPALTGYHRLPNALEFAKRGFAPHLYADVAIGAGTVRLLLDTGAPGAIRLYPSGVRRSGLSIDGRSAIEERRDGALVGHVIRIDRASIGDVVLERPVVTLELHQRGDEYADGVMGLRLLRQLDLAVDPERNDLWIRRNDVAPLPETGRYATL